MTGFARVGHMEMVPGSGPPRRMCRCSYCDAFEVVVCATANPGQARTKLNANGWQVTGKGKAACPKCLAKFRAIKARDKAEDAVVVVQMQPDREATREDRVKILQELDGSYDRTAGRYCGGETDVTVAQRVGVLPGWVAEIREQFFGPDGGNDEMQVVADAIALLLDQSAEHEAACLEMAAKFEAARNELKALVSRVDAIRSAVGPRAASVS